MPFVNPPLSGTLKVIVELAFGFTIADNPATYTWTDVTKYVIGSVSMAAGAPDQADAADPARINLVLANTDGRFTALNPASPYYPNVVLNVPLRVSITWAGASSTYELLTSFVDGWPIQPNAGVMNVTVPLSATGRLRRMRTASAPTRSAMAGSLPGYSPVRSYWPLESEDLTSPIPGVKPASMQFGTWQAVTGFGGSDALPVFGVTAGFGADVAGVFSATGWTVDWYMNFPTDYAGTTNIMQINMPSTSPYGSIAFSLTTTLINVQMLDSFGATLNSFTVPVDPSFFGVWQHFRFTIDHPAGNDIKTLTVNALVDGTVRSNGRTDLSGALVPPASLQIVRSPNLNGTQFGQVVVFDGVSATAMDNAATGWTGELATDRVQRVCNENSIPVIIGSLPASPPPQAMGPQQIASIASILDDCADLDNANFHDAGTLGKLVYNSGVKRYNAAIAFTLDYFQSQIGDGLVATFDDQALVQQWTLTGDGGSATWLSPQVTDPHMDIYSKSESSNAATVAQLMPVAQFRVSLGMFNAYRIPSISVDVRGRNPELAQAMTSLVLPSRISPVNLPSPYPPQSFDQFIEGWSAVVDAVMWQVAFNCSPYTPWQAFVLESSTRGKLDSTTTTLSGAITATETALVVASARVSEWTTDGTQFPFDLSVDGEQVTAIDCNNGTDIMSVDGTFEVDRVAAWGGPNGGTFTDDVTHVHSGAHAAKLVTTGTPSQTFVRTPSVVVTAGDTYMAMMWAFATGSTTNVQVTIDWSNGSFAFLSSNSATVTLAANTWTKIAITATAPVGAVHGQIGPTLQSSPATGKTIWVDDFAFTHQVGAAGSTQTFTVVRASGVRDLALPHSSGTPVSLWANNVLAL